MQEEVLRNREHGGCNLSCSRGVIRGRGCREGEAIPGVNLRGTSVRGYSWRGGLYRSACGGRWQGPEHSQYILRQRAQTSSNRPAGRVQVPQLQSCSTRQNQCKSCKFVFISPKRQDGYVSVTGYVLPGAAGNDTRLQMLFRSWSWIHWCTSQMPQGMGRVLGRVLQFLLDSIAISMTHRCLQ